MNADKTTGTSWGPLPRRATRLTVGALISLALFAGAAAAPAGAAPHQGSGQGLVGGVTPHAPCKGLADRKDKCKDGKTPAAPTVNVGASLFASANQVIPNQTETRILFTGAVYDTDAMFDATSSTLVVNTPGRYLLKGRLLWSYIASETAHRRLIIEVNGLDTAFDSQPAEDRATGFGVSQDVSTIVRLNEGDVIELNAYQNTGADATSVTLSGGQAVLAPQLQAEWLAP
ncbi:hypothetical protein ACFCW4_20875 [Streptomyces virginiae]|uniref:hypothetical protein n=1 Tax=Streptomyces virginiae TaxID=1961 RepID=UPI0035D5EE47